MPVKGVNSLNMKLDRVANNIETTKLERALYITAIIGAGYASLQTPIDTSNLVNSQYIMPSKTQNGVKISIGYTANYAASVHSKKGTLKGQPRANGNGLYWSPNGEPQFLSKAFNDNRAELNSAFSKAMKV